MAANRKSQEARILEMLIRARGAWIPAPELAAVSLQYNARVFALRRLGFAIENRVETTLGGNRHGFFRLCTGSPSRPASGGASMGPAPPSLDDEDTPFLPFEDRDQVAQGNHRRAHGDQPSPVPEAIDSTLPLFGDQQPERRCAG